ncbi:MAG: hypothetical protein WA584_16345 [Pyrinomonadaceae bacterium]
MALTGDDIKSVLSKKITDNPTLIDSIVGELAALGLDEKTKSDAENAIALYSLEYQKAAERYQSIYTSIWTNFSYMSVVAGAILTFGGNVSSNLSLLTFLASLPLVFWYVGTFIPMNRYGYKTDNRLADIEDTLNKRFGTELKHFTNFAIRSFPRVRHVMFFFGLTLVLFSSFFAYQYFFNRSSLLETSDLSKTEEIARRLFPDSRNETDKKAAENYQLPAAEKDIDRKIQAKLSETTKKLLYDFKSSGYDAPTKELQQNLVYDFNKVIAGEPLSLNEVNRNSVESCKNTYVASSNFIEGSTITNRCVLQAAYGDTIISPPKFPWETLLLITPFLIIVYLSLWSEFKLTFFEKTESALNLVSLNENGSSETINVPQDVLSEFSKLIWRKDVNLLLRIWTIPDLNTVKWVWQDGKELLTTAFVNEKGKLKLVKLNKKKMEELEQNQSIKDNKNNN